MDHLDQHMLERLAVNHTKQKPSLAYRDPAHVKELLRKAKLSKTREAALASRRQARRLWEGQRLQRALFFSLQGG